MMRARDMRESAQFVAGTAEAPSISVKEEGPQLDAASVVNGSVQTQQTATVQPVTTTETPQTVPSFHVVRLVVVSAIVVILFILWLRQKK